MNDLSASWEAEGLPGYRPTTLVLFADAVDTGCGRATAAVGPFYCPADEHAYLDVEFFQELHDRFGAPGDFAQACVIASRVRAPHPERARCRGRARCGSSCRPTATPACGPTRCSGPRRRDDGVSITDDDIREALDAAAAIGDDRIQEQAGVEVNPDTWTHGSSAQRQHWFEEGFDGGDVAACDTFSGDV